MLIGGTQSTCLNLSHCTFLLIYFLVFEHFGKFEGKKKHEGVEVRRERPGSRGRVQLSTLPTDTRAASNFPRNMEPGT